MSNDLEEGWVSRQEIRNVFTEALRQLDKDILPPRHIFPQGEMVISFFEGVKYSLLKLSKPTDELIPKRQPKRPTASEPVVDGRAAHTSRMEGINRRRFD